MYTDASEAYAAVEAEAEAAPEETPADEESGVSLPEEDSRLVYIQDELAEQRSEFTKEFRLEDGSFTHVQYNVPVHYEEDGQWLEIDNTMKAEESNGAAGYFYTQNGKHAAAFAKESGESALFSVTAGDYVLSVTAMPAMDSRSGEYVDVSFGRPAQVPSAMESDKDEKRLSTDVVPDKLSSSVRYEELYPGVTAEYGLYSYDIEEYLILSGPDAPDTYTWYLDTAGCPAELQEDGSVLLLNAAGEVTYTIPAPFMADAAGELSGEVYFSLEAFEAGYLLTMKAERGWLDAPERKYPVVIDPTIRSTNLTASIQGISVYERTPSNALQPPSGYVACGYAPDYGIMQAWLRLQNLPNLENGCTITGTTFLIAPSQYYIYGTGVTTFQAHEPDENYWSTGIVWTQDNLEPAMDYISYTYGYGWNGSGWDITEAVQKWYSGGENKGIVIQADPVNTPTGAHRWTLSSLSSAYVVVNYRNTVGIEGYETYETLSAGRAGNGYVGDFSSGLVIEKADLSYPSTSMPFALSHVYNSCLGGGALNTMSGVHAPDYSAMQMGNGWQLSCMESVTTTVLAGVYYLIYRDGDGTEHYLKSSGGYFYDEDGLGLTGTVSGNAALIRDNEGNSSYFYNGYLMYKLDGNSNQLCFTYNGSVPSANLSSWYPASSGNVLTGVWSAPRGMTTADRICTLNYNNSTHLLSEITDYAGRTTYYSYDAGGRLTTVTHPDGTTASYRYDTAGRMINLYDGESCCGVELAYNDGVSEIHEYAVNPDTEEMTYGASVIRVKTSVQETRLYYDGADRILETDDDIVTIYAFDYTGRTINATTLNSDLSEVLGVTAAAYTENSDTSGANNHIEKDGQAGQAGVNLLQCGGCEQHDSLTNNSNFWLKTKAAATGYNAVVKTGELAHTGSSALKIYLNYNCARDDDGKTRGGLYQSVTLEADKTYTFSAYVNTQEITQFSGSGGVYVAFANSGGTILQKGEYLTYNTSAEIENGWERISVTYKPGLSGTYRVQLMAENAWPYIYFDDMQLEEGTVPSTVNLLQNGDFSHHTSEWTAGSMSVSYTDDVEGVRYYYGQLTGTPANMVRASQTVPLNIPAENTFLLSAWGRADSAGSTKEKLTAATAENNPTGRYFGLIAKCTYRNSYNTENSEYFYMPFNDDYDDWQYASCIIAPKRADRDKTLVSIQIICAYDHNINTCYLDKVSLRKEPCSTYAYDNKGNLTAVNASGSGGSDFAYEAGTTKLTASSSGATGNYAYAYNDSRNDHLVTTIANDGAYLYIGYDDYGNSTGTILTSSANTSQRIVTSASYTDNGRQLSSQTDSNGSTTSYSYNTLRQVSRSTDANGTNFNETYYTDSGRHRMSYISGVVSLKNSYTNGRLTEAERGGYLPASLNDSVKRNQYYYLGYTVFGALESVSVGSRELAHYSYGSHNGNLISMEYGNGAAVSYTYDNLDRVVGESWQDALGENTHTYSYLYNSEGALAGKLDVGAGNAVNYEYDSLGRLIHSRQTSMRSSGTGEPVRVLEQETEHIYDRESRLSQQSWRLSNADHSGYTTYSESYEYRSSDGSLKKMHTATGEDVWFGYDPLKRQIGSYTGILAKGYLYRDRGTDNGATLTTTQVKTVGYALPNGQRLSTTLGNITESEIANLLTNISQGSSSESTGVPVFLLNYGYDNLGRITSVARTGAGTRDGIDVSNQNATYTYDMQGQLLSENSVAGNYTYEYDTYGNIRSASNGTSTDTYTYGDSEWHDLLTAFNGQTITYDAIGNPTSYYNGKRWAFTWQNGRQLSTAQFGGKTIAYSYDLSGIRDSKTVTNGDTVTQYRYLTQNGRVVRQFCTTRNTVSGAESTEIIDFIYDNLGNPYAMITGGVTYYYVTNLQGDVIELITETGTIAASYSYDAWGRIIIESGSLARTNPLRYRGYYYDTESDLYYLQSRYYDPRIRRFVNADNSELITSNPNSISDKNLFAYCDNNPTNRKDDGGEFWIVVGAALLGGLGGMVNAAASGSSLAAGFAVGATTAAASSLFGFGAIGGFLCSGLMGGFTAAIGNIYEQKANNPMKEIEWSDVGFAAATGAASAAVTSIAGTVSAPAVAGCKVAEAVITTVTSAFTTTASVSAYGFRNAYRKSSERNKQAALQQRRNRRAGTLRNNYRRRCRK